MLVSDNKNISKGHNNQDQKLHDLFLNNSYHNSGDFYFPGHFLSAHTKSLLSKGFNSKFKICCYIAWPDKHFIKTRVRVRETEFSLCKDTGKIIEKKLSKDELKFLPCLWDEIQWQVKVSKRTKRKFWIILSIWKKNSRSSWKIQTQKWISN